MYGYVPPSYRCPKHGDVGSVIMQVSITPSGEASQTFKYCMYCYNEWLAKNIHQVKEEKDG